MINHLQNIKDLGIRELISITKELALRHEKHAQELTISNLDLALNGRNLSDELIRANIQLVSRNGEEKKSRTALAIANETVKKAHEDQNIFTRALEEIIFTTSHDVRGPIAHILGLSNLLADAACPPDVLLQIIGYIRQSALNLDTSTRKLTAIMNNLKHRVQNSLAVTLP